MKILQKTDYIYSNLHWIHMYYAAGSESLTNILVPVLNVGMQWKMMSVSIYRVGS